MDWNRLYIGAVVLVLGIAGYYSWPFVRDYFAKWRATPAVVPASGANHKAAYEAVLVLIAHFQATGCKEGEAAARTAGEHLFHAEPKA